MWGNILQALYFQDFKFTSLESNEASHTGNYMLFPFVQVTTSSTAICLCSWRCFAQNTLHGIARFQCSVLVPAILKSFNMYFVTICDVCLVLW